MAWRANQVDFVIVVVMSMRRRSVTTKHPFHHANTQILATP